MAVFTGGHLDSELMFILSSPFPRFLLDAVLSERCLGAPTSVQSVFFEKFLQVRPDCIKAVPDFIDGAGGDKGRRGGGTEGQP